MTDTDTRVQTMHRDAMRCAAFADSAMNEGEKKEALRWQQRALRLETWAADLCTHEPTRSVLYRSAATLALDAGEPQEAVRLVQKGLEESPPEEIAAELRAVLAKARGEE